MATPVNAQTLWGEPSRLITSTNQTSWNRELVWWACSKYVCSTLHMHTILTTLPPTVMVSSSSYVYRHFLLTTQQCAPVWDRAQHPLCTWESLLPQQQLQEISMPCSKECQSSNVVNQQWKFGKTRLSIHVLYGILALVGLPTHQCNRKSVPDLIHTHVLCNINVDIHNYSIHL